MVLLQRLEQSFRGSEVGYTSIHRDTGTYNNRTQLVSIARERRPSPGLTADNCYASRLKDGLDDPFHVADWIWGGNNHTVTKSSELSPCNKTTDGTAFATGEHDKGFTFTETVNDTNPLFYYCGTPGHWYVGLTRTMV